MSKENPWYSLNNPGEVISPSLLVFPDRIQKNIRLMIDMSGDVKRLRPHIKTHKTAEIIRMQMSAGIEKFKCATIAEAELLGMCNAPDVLLAMQPVGANVARFIELVKAFPLTKFSTLVDNKQTIQQLSVEAADTGCNFGLYLDLNTGMNRTGIIPDAEALDVYRAMWNNDVLRASGLHAYDGHIRQEDIEERKIHIDQAFDAVLKLKADIEDEGMEVRNVVAGGSPSFPIHAKRANVQASPGTTLLWDERYGSLFSDMDFIPAAVLFCRIVSKPTKDLICLDLGHKSIAPEMDFPRVRIFGLEDCQQISQSEEHLVLKCADAKPFSIGDAFYAVPMHICPTVAKYSMLQVVENGDITGTWSVAARNHKLTI